MEVRNSKNCFLSINILNILMVCAPTTDPHPLEPYFHFTPLCNYKQIMMRDNVKFKGHNFKINLICNNKSSKYSVQLLLLYVSPVDIIKECEMM